MQRYCPSFHRSVEKSLATSFLIFALCLPGLAGAQEDLLERATRALQAGSPAEAVEMLAPFVAGYSDDEARERGQADDGAAVFGRANSLLGLARLGSGDAPGAELNFRRAIELGWDLPSSMYNLACSQARQEEVQLALVTLREAAEFGAEMEQAWNDPDLALLQNELAFVTLLEEVVSESTQMTRTARQFDFWVGDWNVEKMDGTPIGTNRISLVEGGAGLLEQWRSSRGGTGTSLSYYDPLTETWVQAWLTRGQGAAVARGGLEGESMVLVGYASDGVTATGRTTWTPLPDGRVRQHWESTKDGGASWATVFDGYYVRR